MSAVVGVFGFTSSLVGDRRQHLPFSMVGVLAGSGAGARNAARPRNWAAQWTRQRNQGRALARRLHPTTRTYRNPSPVVRVYPSMHSNLVRWFTPVGFVRAGLAV